MAKATKTFKRAFNELGHEYKVNASGEGSPLPKHEYSIDDIIEDCYSADTETTTESQLEKDGNTHVWLWGCKSIVLPEEHNTYWDTNINSLIETFDWLSDKHYPYPANIAFHNLKFDFSFIENYLLDQGWNLCDNVSLSKQNTNRFQLLRNDMGQIYQVIIKFGRHRSVKLIDFAKIMPQKLAGIGEALDIPKLIGTVDYHKYRGLDYEVTETELKYLWADIDILATAWKITLETEGKFKLSRSGYAYEAVKYEYELTQEVPDLVDFKNFKRDFPDTEPEVYSPIRYVINDRLMTKWVESKNKKPLDPQLIKDKEAYYAEVLKCNSMGAAYTGGKVFTHPKYTGKILNKRIVSIDYTSLYPSQWLNRKYPYGQPQVFDGMYEHDKKYPLYIQAFTAKFTLKKGGFPILGKVYSQNNKQIYSSENLKDPKLTLCDVDLNLFFENYEVSEIQFLGGFKFKAKDAPFKSFVEKYAALKQKYSSKQHWNPILRLMSKLTMNGGYGKFGQSPFLYSKEGYLDDKGVTRFDIRTLTSQPMAYLPIAIWTTAYGRESLNSMVHKIGVERVLYIDTDSIKAFCDWDSKDPKINWTLQKGIKEMILSDDFIEKHGTDLNSWEDEYKIHHFKMLRDKAYIMHLQKTIAGKTIDYVDIKAAGLSDEAKDSISCYFDKEGRKLYYDVFTGAEVWEFDYNVKFIDHKPALFPKHRPWNEVFDDFRFGRAFKGGMTVSQQPGGAVLMDTTKILTEDAVYTYITESGEEAPITDLYL